MVANDAEVMAVPVVVEAVQVLVEVVDVVAATFVCLESTHLTVHRPIETTGRYLLVYSQLAPFLF